MGFEGQSSIVAQLIFILPQGISCQIQSSCLPSSHDRDSENREFADSMVCLEMLQTVSQNGAQLQKPIDSFGQKPGTHLSSPSESICLRLLRGPFAISQKADTQEKS